MGISLITTIMIMALLTGACTDTFMLTKNGRRVFFSSNVNAKYNVLCESGDLIKVLNDSNLSKEMKDTLYLSTCSAERSGEKVRQIYASMTVVQRKDIKTAFRKNGFSINQIG